MSPCEKGGYENQVLLLTVSRTLTLKDVSNQVSRFLGRCITLRVVSEDEYVSANVGKQGPWGKEQFLRKWATTYKALERGETGVVDPVIQEVLRRELKPFESTLKEVLGVSADVSVMEQYAK